MFSMFFGFGILWLIGAIVIIIAIIDIVKQSKMDGANKIIWLLIVVLFNLIGSIIYFVVIKNSKDKNLFKFGNGNIKNKNGENK
ncbi:MAG: PLDc_N domain-containing protein [Candidatus Acididesulfobacter diazotrophicus]|uniref:PLDc_N domain-containing protein n=1 Tax=Candidatus Acididesulfobacter diazotrophicus TaxID=2597226 RepID=A0A519BNT3_9DELT|nr:MAG: PLDc_N domain-containing protein [Candidatus Acididesulfobacter diazotrophicus]